MRKEPIRGGARLESENIQRSDRYHTLRRELVELMREKRLLISDKDRRQFL